MPAVCYIDTSALLKRFVAETFSDAFDDFVQTQLARGSRLLLSPLSETEMVSALKRRQRMGDIDGKYLAAAYGTFQKELASGLWSIRPIAALAYSRATELILTLGTPLATLDALHLANASLFGCDSLATADARLAHAARATGLHSFTFYEDAP